jgi:hypothetical protein
VARGRAERLRAGAPGYAQSSHAELVLEAGPEWDGYAVGLRDFHDVGGTVGRRREGVTGAYKKLGPC